MSSFSLDPKSLIGIDSLTNLLNSKNIKYPISSSKFLSPVNKFFTNIHWIKLPLIKFQIVRRRFVIFKQKIHFRLTQNNKETSSPLSILLIPALRTCRLAERYNNGVFSKQLQVEKNNVQYSVFFKSDHQCYRLLRWNKHLYYLKNQCPLLDQYWHRFCIFLKLCSAYIYCVCSYSYYFQGQSLQSVRIAQKTFKCRFSFIYIY
jgi:hypothetical protein